MHACRGQLSNRGHALQARDTAVFYSNHAVGSCGIGRVVGTDLKVMGFDNLRVVDASVIPDIPENAGPAGTTYMLAEYMAERLVAEDSGSTIVFEAESPVAPPRYVCNRVRIYSGFICNQGM